MRGPRATPRRPGRATEPRPFRTQEPPTLVHPRDLTLASKAAPPKKGTGKGGEERFDHRRGESAEEEYALLERFTNVAVHAGAFECGPGSVARQKRKAARKERPP